MPCDCVVGVAASQEQDFGTANIHMEVSDIVSVLVYVGVAKGNGVLSKTGRPLPKPCFSFQLHFTQQPAGQLGKPSFLLREPVPLWPFCPF